MAVRHWVPVALAALAFAPHAHGQGKKVRVAVLEIRALGTEAAKAELLSEVALTEAASLKGFEVIGRSDINSLIGFERQKQVIGCSDDSNCLAEIGGALGVDFILVGSLGRLGTLYRIDLKLVETKKARVRGRIGVSVEGQEEKLVVAIQKAVRDLLLPETPTAAPPVAGAEKRPDLTPRPEQAGRAPAQPPQERAGRSGGLSRRTWAYIAGGAGLAFIAGGAVAGLQAQAAFDDQKAAQTLQAYDDAKTKADSMALLADGLYGVGVVGVGVGVWLFVTGHEPAVALDVAPLPDGALVTLQGGF